MRQKETIFLSYVREDEAVVVRLADELRNKGAVVWRDRDSLEPGVPWADAIGRAIERGTYFVPCFSRHYAARQDTYMNQELRLACAIAAQKSSNGRAQILPVCLDDTPIPTFNDERQAINQLHYVHLTPSWEDGLRRLAEATVHITKNRAMEELDRQAAEVFQLELAAYRTQQQSYRAQAQARVRQMQSNAHPQGAAYPAGDAFSMARSAMDEHARITATLAEKRALYKENIEAYWKQYKDDYNPYASPKYDLVRGKAEIDAALRQEQERESREEGRFIKWALIFFVGLALLVSLVINMVEWLTSHISKWLGS